MVTRLTQPGVPHPHTVPEHGAGLMSLPLARRANAVPLPHHISFELAQSPCAECTAHLAPAHWHCRKCVWRKE